MSEHHHSHHRFRRFFRKWKKMFLSFFAVLLALAGCVYLFLTYEAARNQPDPFPYVGSEDSAGSSEAGTPEGNGSSGQEAGTPAAGEETGDTGTGAQDPDRSARAAESGSSVIGKLSDLATSEKKTLVGAVNELSSGMVRKDQGPGNAGKILGISSSGIVVPVSLPVSESDSGAQVLTVSASGGKQYESLRDAVEFASQTANAENRFEIHVYPGVYDILSCYSAEEIAADGFQGLTVTNGISLIGIGPRSGIILTAAMDRNLYSEKKCSDVSTLNILGNVTVKNMTVLADSIRYAVRDDATIRPDQEDIHVYEELTLRGTNLTSGAGGIFSFGAEVSGNKQLYFRNVDFSDAMTIRTADDMEHGSTVLLENCRARLMSFLDVSSGSPTYCYLKNCVTSRIELSPSGEKRTQFLYLEGEGVRDAMVLCPAGYVYALDGVHKFLGSDVPAGTAVQPDSTMTGVVPASSVAEVYGVCVGSANGSAYVQTEGWLNSNTLGLSGLSVGDYLTVNSGTGAVEGGGTAENAVAQVRFVDADGVAYAKIIE